MATLTDAQHLFEAFVERMIANDFVQANRFLSEETGLDWTPERLAQGWEALMRGDGPAVMFNDTTAVDAMDNWPDRHATDVAWVYVPVLDDAVNEALSGIVLDTPAGLKIRALEFGTSAVET